MENGGLEAGKWLGRLGNSRVLTPMTKSPEQGETTMDLHCSLKQENLEITVSCGNVGGMYGDVVHIKHIHSSGSLTQMCSKCLHFCDQSCNDSLIV